MRENWDLFRIFKVLILWLLSSQKHLHKLAIFKKNLYFKLAFQLPMRSTMDSAVEESKGVGDHYEGY